MPLKLLAVLSLIVLSSTALEAAQPAPQQNQPIPKEKMEKLKELLKRKGPPVEVVNSLRQQIGSCWSKPAQLVPVRVKIRYKKDGALDGTPELQNRDDSLAYLRSAVAAIEAIQKCQPIHLSPQHYDGWKEILIEFTEPALAH